jgi:F0F1-type ATP synthase membrane subunit b/b'
VIVDPVLMVGAWAAALMAIIGLGRILYHAFVKAVKVAIREELGRVWKDQDEIEQRLSALELSVQFVRQQLEDLRAMMQAHVDTK